MDTSNPGPLLLLGGGVLIALSTILDQRAGDSGLSFDVAGLYGLLMLVIGVGIAVVGASRAFGFDLPIPDEILGLSLDKWALIEGFTAFIWAFALITAEFVDFGVHLQWIGGAVVVAGAVLSLRQAPAATV